MRKIYYSGGLGELILTGTEPLRLAELEELSLSLDFNARTLRSDWETGPSEGIKGPGTGTIICRARVLTQGFPDAIGPSGRVFTRQQEFTVPEQPPFKVQLQDDVLEHSLLVETQNAQFFDKASLPGPGCFSYDPISKSLEFHQQDAGKQIMVSYAFGHDPQAKQPTSGYMGIIMVFPLLGRLRTGGFKVLEARRVMLSSYQEEFSRDTGATANMSFVLLSDQDGYLVRQSIWEPEE